jgi:hypothetical protein
MDSYINLVFTVMLDIIPYYIICFIIVLLMLFLALHYCFLQMDAINAWKCKHIENYGKIMRELPFLCVLIICVLLIVNSYIIMYSVWPSNTHEWKSLDFWSWVHLIILSRDSLAYEFKYLCRNRQGYTHIYAIYSYKSRNNMGRHAMFSFLVFSHLEGFSLNIFLRINVLKNYCKFYCILCLKFITTH